MRQFFAILVLLLAAGSAFVGCRYGRAGVVLGRLPRVAEPKNAEVLYEDGDSALYAGETAEDVAHNEAERRKSDPFWFHNSLFLRCMNGWRLVMTSGKDLKDADGMNKWCRNWADDVREDFRVLNASISKDGRTVYMACDPFTFTYFVACSIDLEKGVIRVFGDGDLAKEQPDGTILVTGRKTYLSDENGEPLGAAWYDEWFTPNGKSVRKGRPIPRSELEAQWAAEQEKKDAAK